jgi:YD repeat-containing protein
VYDGAGRVTTTYTTDGAGGSSFSDPVDVSGDHVLEQIETTFDASGNDHSTTTRQRFHDETGTGVLGTPSSGNHARVSYAANYYDAADRPTATADFGTNGGNAWTRPGTAPTRGQASFAGTDTTTQGSWIGKYGADGYTLAGGFGTSLPAYATVSTGGAAEYTWASTTSATQALQKPPNPSDRAAATWNGYTTASFEVNLTDGHAHRVSLYVLDWEFAGRAMTIEVRDHATGTVLDSESVSSFSGGKWLSWDLAGDVDLRFSYSAGGNWVVSAIAFDAAGSSPPVPALVMSQTYDAAGNVYESTDPKGIVNRTTYDALGRTTTYVNDGTLILNKPANAIAIIFGLVLAYSAYVSR